MKSFVVVRRESDQRLVFLCNDGTEHDALVLDASACKPGETATAPDAAVVA